MAELIPNKRLLSSTPSTAIRQALEDLEAVEADPRYTIDMGLWHDPMSDRSRDVQICHVCMAGAVMAAYSGRPDATLRTYSRDLGYGGQADQLRVEAFDDLRRGRVLDFLAAFFRAEFMEAADNDRPLPMTHNERLDRAHDLDRAFLRHLSELSDRGEDVTWLRSYAGSAGQFKTGLATFAAFLESQGH